MRRVETNLAELDELIARQYEDKIRGFAKDTLQNSWEARKNRKHGTDFKMRYSFFRDLDGMKNVLVLEDSGTIGMNKERWKAFHSHWVSTKGGSYSKGIGRWGQGKTLLLYFSSINTIITETFDIEAETYKYSIRNNTGFLQNGDTPDDKDPEFFKNKDGSLKNISDFFPSIKPLNNYGTRIWIPNVKDDLAEEILRGELSYSLAESWWEIIRNYNIDIEVIINDRIEKIMLFKFPDTEDKEDLHNISINSDHGKIKRLKIVLSEDIIKPSLRGIAIQRGGMTVCRHPFPASTPERLRDRCYGYCQLDDKLDEEMWEIELANHEGFEARKAVWIKLRRTIDSEVEKFISKHTRTNEVEDLPFDINDIVKTVNKLVSEHLEGLGPSNVIKYPPPPKPPRPQEPIRISPWGYYGSNRRFDEGDILEPKGSIINDTESEEIVLFESTIENESGTVYWNYSIDKVKIEAASKVVLDIPGVELSKISLRKGRYHLTARILKNDNKVIHKRSAVFYYEEDPPMLGGWLKIIKLSAISAGPYSNHRNVPISQEGELIINIAYIEIGQIWNSRNYSKVEKVRRIKPLIINIALHEATKEVMIIWWGDESIDFDIEEIERGKDILDEMWADYIRGEA